MRTSGGKKFGVRLTSSVQIPGRLQREVIPRLEEEAVGRAARPRRLLLLHQPAVKVPGRDTWNA